MKGKFFPLSFEIAKGMLLLTPDELFEIMQAMIKYDTDGSEPNFDNIEYGNVNSRTCKLFWTALKAVELRG